MVSRIKRSFLKSRGGNTRALISQLRGSFTIIMGKFLYNKTIKPRASETVLRFLTKAVEKLRLRRKI